MPRQSMTSAFDLPPDPPAELVEAHRRYDEMVTKLAETKGDRQDLREAVKRARVEDREALAAAYADGGEPKPGDIDKRERQATAKLAAVEARIPALETACEQVAAELLPVIAKHRDAWLAELEKQLGAASERFDAAIAEAQAAATNLGQAQASVNWVASYSVEGVTSGDVRSFLGKGRLTVEDTLRSLRSSTLHVGDLLKLAGTATDPPPDREPRRHRVAAEAR